MECRTIASFNKKGKAITKLKKKHETFAEANAEAEMINNRKNIFIKRAAYKCNKCKKYHVGTTFEMLENKPTSIRNSKSSILDLKVVGSIDLSKFVKVKKAPDAKSDIINISKDIIDSFRNPSEPLPKQPILNRVIVGRLFINGSFWRYYTKKKTVKIITPDYRIKMIKFIKISDGEILSRNMITRFIKINSKNL